MPFKLSHHDKDFFHAEGAKGPFRISKKGLTKKQHEKYLALCNGGKVPQKLAEGGTVLDAGKEALLAGSKAVGEAGYGLLGQIPGVPAAVAGARSLVKGTSYDEERERLRQFDEEARYQRTPTVTEPYHLYLPPESAHNPAGNAEARRSKPSVSLTDGWNRGLENQEAMEQAMMFAGSGGPRGPGKPPRLPAPTAPLTQAERALAMMRLRGTHGATLERFADSHVADAGRFADTQAATSARFAGEPAPAPVDHLANARSKAAAAGVYGKAGLAGIENAKASKRTVSKIPWKEMNQEEALAFAQAGDHLRQDKTGQFIGFPRGVTTMEQVNAIQEEALRRIRDVGGLGAGWYAKDGEFIRTVAPKNPLEMTRGLATYSPQADPSPNLGWTISNKNQLLVDPEKASLRRSNMPKTAGQAKKFLTVTKDLTAPMGKGITGQKISQFAEDLAGTSSTGRPTLDLHAGRAHGFGDKFDRGFTAAEYAAQSGAQNERLARLQRSDIPGPGPGGTWSSVKESQAADWIGSRARGYIRDHFSGAKMADLSPAQQKEVVDFAMRGFADAAPNYQAHTVVEAIPSSQAKDHLSGAASAPLQARQEFTDRFLGPSGTRHPVVEDLGAWGYPSRSGLGTFQDMAGNVEMNPSRTYDTLASYGKGKGGHKVLHGASDRLTDFMGNYEAATGVQAGVPTHAVKTAGSTKGNAYNLSFPEPLSPQATKELYAAVEGTKTPLKKNGKPVLDESGQPQFKTQASLTDTGDGRFTLTGNWGGVDARGFNEMMKKNASPELRAALERAQVTPGGYTTGTVSEMPGYVNYEKEWKRSPVDPDLLDDKAPVTRKFVRALKDEPTIMKNLGGNEAIKADALRKFMANQAAPEILGSGPPRANVQKLLSEISKGGLPGLLDYVKVHGYKGLPAILPFLMAGQGSEEKPKGFSQGGMVGDDGDFFVTLAADGSIMRVSKQALSPKLRGQFEGRVQRFDEGGPVLPLDPATGIPLGEVPLDPAAGVAPQVAPQPAPSPFGSPQIGEPAYAQFTAPGETAAREAAYAGPGTAPAPLAAPPGPGGPASPDEASQRDLEGIGKALRAPIDAASYVLQGKYLDKAPEPGAGVLRPTGASMGQTQAAFGNGAPTGGLPAPAPSQGMPLPNYPAPPVVPGFNGSALSAEIGDATKEIAFAQNDKAAIETKALNDIALKEQQKHTDLIAIGAEQKKLLDTRNATEEALFNETRNAKIDPAHFFQGKETYQKVLAGIGMLLSGAGSGLTGQPNMAMDVINRAIDRDIDAQKANLANKRNLLSYHLQKTDSLLNATNLTKATMLEATAASIEARSSQMKSDLAGPQHRLEVQQARQQAAALRGQVSLQEIQAASARYELEMQRYKLRMIDQMTRQDPTSHPGNGADNTRFLQTAARLGFVNEANIAHELVEEPKVNPATGRVVIDTTTGQPLTTQRVVWRLYGSPDGQKEAEGVYQTAAVFRPSLQKAMAIIQQNPTGTAWLQSPESAAELRTEIAAIKIMYERAIGAVNRQPNEATLNEIEKALGNPGGVTDAVLGRSYAALRAINGQLDDRLKAMRFGAHY